MDLSELRWNDDGLIVVVAQDRHVGDIRMVAWADREAVEATIATGEAHFHSRSRGKLWKKGEESGNVLDVAEVWTDCDADALIYLVEARGPSCHTGVRTCFFRRVDADGGENAHGEPTFARLEPILEARRAATGDKSYTRSLLDKGAAKIGAKLREEAGELDEALQNETDDRVASESGDVLYHLMVGLVLRRLSLRDVGRSLAARFGVSGHDEKASRKNA